MSVRPEIVVVGSINLDISVVVDALPLPGETVLGSDALWNGGGKGANQAVAAAKLGRRVAMVGAVGADSAGAEQLANLSANGVDVAGVVTIDDAPTGLAMIVVDERAENNIVVSPGANARLTPEAVAAAGVLDDAAIVLVQFEVPADVVWPLANGARSPCRQLLLPPVPHVRACMKPLGQSFPTGAN
ncbi:MAG: PfkB family carbohydrate kinase [Acidimicrobiales bacterium]